MPASEMAEWELFYSLEPFGTWRDNMHAGIIASLLANIHRGKSTKRFTPQDFMLLDGETHKRERNLGLMNLMSSVAKKRK